MQNKNKDKKTIKWTILIKDSIGSVVDKCSDFMTSPGIVTEPLYYIVKKGLGFLKKEKDYFDENTY